MTLPLPFDWLSSSQQKAAFFPLLILTFVLMIALGMLGKPLRTDKAPRGILSFQLAGDLSTARRILDSWDPAAKIHAGLSLGLDYLFLFAYSTTIALACGMLARGLSPRLPVLATIGAVLAWGQLLAALLDAVENWALIQLLLGRGRDVHAAVARWCALPKFAIVGIGVLYLVLGLLALFFAGRTTPS